MKILEILNNQDLANDPYKAFDNPYALSMILIAFACKNVDNDPEPLYDEDIFKIFKAINIMLETLPEPFEEIIKLRDQLKERIIDKDTCVKIFKNLEYFYRTALEFSNTILPNLNLDTLQDILDKTEETPRAKRTRKLEL